MSEKEVKKYSMAEVREKAEAKLAWVVINDSVYDVAGFLNDVRLSSVHTLAVRVSFICYILIVFFYSILVAKKFC